MPVSGSLSGSVTSTSHTFKVFKKECFEGSVKNIQGFQGTFDIINHQRRVLANMLKFEINYIH